MNGRPRSAQLLLTFVGRYHALLVRPAQAVTYFRAALAPELGPPIADAQLGLTQALLAVGEREEAANQTLSFWRTSHRLDATPTRAHIHMAILLAALSEELLAPPADALLLLRRLIPTLTTAACSAVEALAARWLPTQVPANLCGGGEHMLLAEPFVQSALASSRTFGALALEPLVCAARRQLLFILLRQSDPGGPDSADCPGGAGGASGSVEVAMDGHGVNSGCITDGACCIGPAASCSDHGITVQVSKHPSAFADDGGARHKRLEAAAVLACWCYSADFCMEETAAEAQAVAAACGVIEARLAGASPIEWPLAHYTYLAAVGMYQDLSELRAVETWLREPELAAEIGRRLRAAGLHAVWNMLEAHVTLPRARARRAEKLAVLTPILSSTVRQFYDETIYPRWYVAEFFGVARAPSIVERMRRQYRHFSWPCGGDPHEHRVLIAGAGSGHQVAQAMLSIEHVGITAVDISARTLAYAHQKLHQQYPQETARRVRFAVADLIALPAAGLPPFELVAAIGVLHHVPRDQIQSTLQNLSGALVPGGVLQLGTYSTLGTRAWWEPTRRLVHRLAPSLVDAAGQIVRQPAPHELRDLRAALMDLDRRATAPDSLPAVMRPSDDELAACSYVVRSAEFFTSTGCRDLLLHPCECSFTLLELGQMLVAADLELVGMWFQTPEADRCARDAYNRSAAVDGYTTGDAPDLQVDLGRWHRLEQVHPNIFGRMHVLYAQKKVH